MKILICRNYGLAILLVACCASAPLFASSSTISAQDTATVERDVPRIKAIIDLVARDPSQPTKQTHDQFWQLMMELSHLSSVNLTPSEVQDAFLQGAVQAWPMQVAFWNSVRLSAATHRVVITKNLAALRKSLPKEATIIDVVGLQNAMLRAAASGAPYSPTSGPPVVLSESYAEQVLAKIKPVEERIRVLLNPKWR